MEVRCYRRRLPHIHVPGAATFLTFRLAARQEQDLSPAEREVILIHIGRMGPGTVHAFVVMPDHVHVVYEPAANENLVRSIQALKGASSHSLTRRYGWKAPVWQDETYDHVIRNEREFLETLAYIEANPVRRGLVEVVEEYRWSSAWARRG